MKFLFLKVFYVFFHLTCFTNFVFLEINFENVSNKFIFVEVWDDVHISISQPPMPQQILIMHTWKTFIMVIIFFNINCINIFTSMAHEDGFVILNVFDDAMKYFKNHFKTFVT